MSAWAYIYKQHLIVQCQTNNIPELAEGIKCHHQEPLACRQDATASMKTPLFPSPFLVEIETVKLQNVTANSCNSRNCDPVVQQFVHSGALHWSTIFFKESKRRFRSIQTFDAKASFLRESKWCEISFFLESIVICGTCIVSTKRVRRCLLALKLAFMFALIYAPGQFGVVFLPIPLPY